MKFIITILFSLIVGTKSITNILTNSVSSLEEAFDNYNGNCIHNGTNLTNDIDENRILFRSRDESNEDMCVISTQINNWKSNLDEIVWQYFASNDRLYAVYPYFDPINLTDCYNYEIQPWYVSAVTGRKNIVILMDTSYSDDGELVLMRMKKVVDEFLYSLSINDYVTIVDYSSFARLYENASLVQGTTDNLGYLRSYVNGISVSQISNSDVDSALDKVNGMFNGGNCGTNIYVLLDKSGSYVDMSSLNNSLFFHYIFEGNQTMCGNENYSFGGFVDYFSSNCSDIDYISVINSTYSKMVCTENEGFKGVMGMNTSVSIDNPMICHNYGFNESRYICDNGIEEVDEEGVFLWLVTLALIIVFSVLITVPLVYVFRVLKDKSFRSIINLKCNIIWTNVVMIVLFGWFVLAFYLAIWDEIIRESNWVFTDMIVDAKDEGSLDCCFIGGCTKVIDIEGENCLELKGTNVEGECIFNGEICSTICGECYEPIVLVSYFDSNFELVSSMFGESCEMNDMDCLDKFLDKFPEINGSFGGYYNRNNSLEVMYSIVDRNDALGWTISAVILIVCVAVAQWLMIWDYSRKN